MESSFCWPPSGDPPFVPSQYRPDSSFQPLACSVECAHADQQQLTVFLRFERAVDPRDGFGVPIRF